jgi:hypothetical protein
VVAQTFFSLGKFLSNGFFFRSCRGGPFAFALARPVFGFCATRKSLRSEVFTANEAGKELSTICGDKRTFESLKASRFAALPQIVQKLTKSLKPINRKAFPRQRKKPRGPGKNHHPSKHPCALELRTRGAKKTRLTSLIPAYKSMASPFRTRKKGTLRYPFFP